MTDFEMELLGQMRKLNRAIDTLLCIQKLHAKRLEDEYSRTNGSTQSTDRSDLGREDRNLSCTPEVVRGSDPAPAGSGDTPLRDWTIHSDDDDSDWIDIYRTKTPPGT